MIAPRYYRKWGSIIAAVAASTCVLGGCSSLPFISSSSATSASNVVVVSDDGALAKKVDVDFPPIDDANIVSCSSQGSGNWLVAGQVKNPTPQDFYYSVVVDLRTASGITIDQVTASPVTIVKSQQNGNWSYTATAEPSTVTACRVTSVIRSAP